MMPDAINTNNALVGINLADLFDPAKRSEILAKLGPQGLAALANNITAVAGDVSTKQETIKKTAEADSFLAIGTLAKDKMVGMSWEKLPKIILLPNTDGTAYTVQYVPEGKGKANRQPGEKKRTPPDVNTGDVTINKIATSMGGIAFFKVGDKEYETIKETVHALFQPVPKLGADSKPELDAAGTAIMVPGTVSEVDRCWDISKKGISASDILTRYHATEVVLIFNDKTEKTVEQAVADMKAARTAAATAAAA